MEGGSLSEKTGGKGAALCALRRTAGVKKWGLGILPRGDWGVGLTLTERGKVNALSPQSTGFGWLRPCLLKKFKILYHIKSLNTYRKY